MIGRHFQGDTTSFRELLNLGPADKTAWVEDALCAQTNPDAFYPEKGGSTREAKQVCLGCPVRSECLEYAMDRGERFGIWGGKSERERRKLLAQLDAAEGEAA